jgi:hypothetical protein
MWWLVRFFNSNETALVMTYISNKANERLTNIFIKDVNENIENERKRLGRQLTIDEIKEMAEDMDATIKRLHPHEAYLQSDKYNQEIIVNRNDLVYLYLSTYNRDVVQTFEQDDSEGKMENLEFREKTIQIKSILENCIDARNDFIRRHKIKNTCIYLTGKGKQFVGIDG